MVAALRGEFAKVYNGRRLRTQAQAALVARFAGRGESLVDVISHVTVDKADEDGWKQLWTNLFKGPGFANCDEMDLDQFFLWARARGAGAPEAAKLGNSQAKKALDILDANGVQISPSVRTDIETAMAAADAGSEREQCCSALAVWFIYFGRSPLPEETEWWNIQFNSGGGLMGGRVEITKCPSYMKIQYKAPESLLTLERALRKPSEDQLTEWSMQTTEALNKAGLGKASAMLMRVIVKANRFGQGHWPRKRAYLYGYFFEEYTGIGLPSDFAYQSAINAQSVPIPTRLKEGPRSEMGGSDAGSNLGSLAGSGLGGFSTLGDSASMLGGSAAGGGLGDLSGLAEVIKRSIEEGLSGLKNNSGDDSSRAGATCMYCKKRDCPMPAGGRPCRDANRAAGLLNEKRKADRESKDKGGD